MAMLFAIVGGVVRGCCWATLLAGFVAGDLSERAADVELIELNHSFDEHGKLVFHQIIFWRWSHSAARFQVCAWRLVKQPDAQPRRTANGWRYQWWEREHLRQVWAPQYRETWTQHDPEVDDREFLPKNKRAGLYP